MLALLLLLALVLPTAAVASTSPSTSPSQTASPTPSAPSDGATGATATPATPLRVLLSSLTPGFVGPSDGVVLTGSVTNSSDGTWEDVNVATFVGATPISDRAELGLAADTTEETEVGSRLDAPGTFVGVGTLEPGEEVDFRLVVPRAQLPSTDAPGVYWIGVHALGTDESGRDSVADGRARTFVPVLPAATRRPAGGSRPDGAAPDTSNATSTDTSPTGPVVPVSLVLPLRQSALRGADGSLADPERWTELVGTDGRLERLSRFADSADGRPLTWLLDPAVLDALSDLGQGNQPLSLGPRERAEPEPGPDPSPSPTGSPTASPTASASPTGSPTSSDGARTAVTDDPSPTPTPTPTPTASPTDGPGAQTPVDPDAPVDDIAPGDGVPDQAEAAAARSLLARFADALAQSPVLALPYGDVDAMSLLRRAPRLMQTAIAQSRATVAARGLQARTVVAPPSGRVDPGVLDRLPTDVGLVASDQGDLEVPAATTYDGHELLLADARVGDGGPAPVAALDPLALRQRLLADSYLESTTAEATGATPRPVVLVLPGDWDPGPSWANADFFAGADAPWLRWSDLPTPTSPATGTGTDTDTGTSSSEVELSYPRGQVAREVSSTVIAAARELARTGGVLDDLLANDNDVLPRLTGAALETVSYAARTRPRPALESAEGLTRSTRADLESVSILVTPFFTLSSETGTLTVTVVNDLAQPVTVGVGASADQGVTIEPYDPVELGPDQRATVRLPISSTQGVHDVSLVPLTVEGQPTGSRSDFVVRTSQVGRAVWAVVAGGALLFLVTLLRRVRQRLREGRRLRTRATKAAEEQEGTR